MPRSDWNACPYFSQPSLAEFPKRPGRCLNLIPNCLTLKLSRSYRALTLFAATRPQNYPTFLLQGELHLRLLWARGDHSRRKILKKTSEISVTSCSKLFFRGLFVYRLIENEFSSDPDTLDRESVIEEHQISSFA